MDLGLAVFAGLGVLGSAHVAHGLATAMFGASNSTADDVDAVFDDLVAATTEAVHGKVVDALRDHGAKLLADVSKLVADTSPHPHVDDPHPDNHQ